MLRGRWFFVCRRGYAMFAAKRACFPAVSLACSLMASAAGATGCRQDIVVPIQFQPRAVCWRHVGVGTTFNGQFAAHQHITAAAIGQTYNSNGTRTWITTGHWQLSVSGPGGFFASDDGNGQLDA